MRIWWGVLWQWFKGGLADKIRLCAEPGLGRLYSGLRRLLIGGFVLQKSSEGLLSVSIEGATRTISQGCIIVSWLLFPCLCIPALLWSATVWKSSVPWSPTWSCMVSKRTKRKQPGLGACSDLLGSPSGPLLPYSTGDIRVLGQILEDRNWAPPLSEKAARSHCGWAPEVNFGHLWTIPSATRAQSIEVR